VIVFGSAWLLHASIDPADEDVPAAEGRARSLLNGVKSWGYQLQGVDVAEAARSETDLLVLDETVNGQRHPAAIRRNVARLKRKPDGSRRLVIAYLSIGEAEDYRPYWRLAWVSPAPALRGEPVARSSLPSLATTPAHAGHRRLPPNASRPLNVPAKDAPAWLGAENPHWRGNYSVRFWHPDWHGLLYGHKDSALDRLLAAGFDGVYLDRADVHHLWQSEQATARDDMVRLIELMAAHARRSNPEFLVVMQNAEELLDTPRLRRSLDAVAKEDLLYGVDGAEQANKPADVTSSLGHLRLARGEGLPVLVVEYLTDKRRIEEARRRIEGEGFVPNFAPRALNVLGRAS
jgi:cysteinyl-tRNA synthetase